MSVTRIDSASFANRLMHVLPTLLTFNNILTLASFWFALFCNRFFAFGYIALPVLRPILVGTRVCCHPATLCSNYILGDSYL